MNAIVQPWQLAAHDPVATTTQRRPRLFRGLSGRQMTQVRRTFDDDRFADGDVTALIRTQGRRGAQIARLARAAATAVLMAKT